MYNFIIQFPGQNKAKDEDSESKEDNSKKKEEKEKVDVATLPDRKFILQNAPRDRIINPFDVLGDPKELEESLRGLNTEGSEGTAEGDQIGLRMAHESGLLTRNNRKKKRIREKGKGRVRGKKRESDEDQSRFIDPYEYYVEDENCIDQDYY